MKRGHAKWTRSCGTGISAVTDDASAAAFFVLYGIFKETSALEKQMKKKRPLFLSGAQRPV